MDHLIYTAMSGAKHVMEQQATTSNNLANATTTGFRAQIDAFRSVPIVGDGSPTRSFVVDASVGNDYTPGPTEQTGRSLDVAVQGSGWLTVQQDDGTEAYTRSGSLKTNENGVLQTQKGQTVLGNDGPISIPPNLKIAIGDDGTVSSIDTTTSPSTVTILGTMKLVNPPTQTLVRGDDGLFRTASGTAADVDPNVKVQGGALEGSNVNVVDAMVSMINLSRQFDLHMSMLKTAETTEQSAEQLFTLS